MKKGNIFNIFYDESSKTGGVWSGNLSRDINEALKLTDSLN